MRPERRPVRSAPVVTRPAIPDRIRVLQAEMQAAGRRGKVARLFVKLPCVGPFAAVAIAAALDEPSRILRSSGLDRRPARRRAAAQGRRSVAAAASGSAETE